MQPRKIDDDLLLKMIRDKSRAEVASHFGVSVQAIGKRLRKLKAYEPPASFKKLTPKKQRFVLSLVSDPGKTQGQAAKEAYNTSNGKSANVIGCQTMKDPNVQEAIEDLKASNAEIMRQVGINRPKVFRKLETIIDSADKNVSLKAIETAGKFGGWLAPDKILVMNNFDMQTQLMEIDAINKAKKELYDKLNALKAEKTGEDQYEAKSE